MLKPPLAVIAITSVLVTLATGAVAQKVPPEIPLAVICWNERTKTWQVGNLSAIKEDGTATYIATDGRLSSTVNAKGVVVPPSNRPANITSTASARPLDHLRAMGRVIEFQRPR